MALSEADTRAKLVNLAIYARGWTEDHIKREETIGAVDIIAGKARRRAKRRTGLTLRIVVTAEMQPVAVAVIEVKKDTLAPGHGLDQARGYARKIILPDRVKAMCRDLFEQMLPNVIHRAPDGMPLGK